MITLNLNQPTSLNLYSIEWSVGGDSGGYTKKARMNGSSIQLLRSLIVLFQNVLMVSIVSLTFLYVVTN